MGWSMDRNGVRTWFDRQSKRLKQVELSASGRERVSLATYPDDLAAREAEFCKDAKYGDWCEQTAAAAAGTFDRAKPKVSNRQNNGHRMRVRHI